MLSVYFVVTLCAVIQVTLASVRSEYPGPVKQQGYGYQKTSYSYHKRPSKSCYQCAYSPPKTYYDKKVVVENYQYGQQKVGYQDRGYGPDRQVGYQDKGYGADRQDGYGRHGGYYRKTYVPVRKTVYGGWDKCLGPFDHYQAKDYGIDVWECHSNCYTRKDPNGDIFRGCYKGEYNVNPNVYGCSIQEGSLWCFCDGDKCNNDRIH